MSLKESIPQYPTKLPGSFWGLTTFYNPCRYGIRLENYKRFRESGKRQGLKLLCVELAFDNNDFQLTKKDAEILIQRRTTSVLWQKERLLNVGLEYLPKDCDKIAWIDADTIFLNNSWMQHTCESLESYKVVQPYSFAVRLPRGVPTLNPDSLCCGKKLGQRFYGAAYGVTFLGKDSLLYAVKGFNGLAWAARRSIFDKNGFYDRLILGAGDLFMAHAFYGSNNHAIRHFSTKKMAINQDKWIKSIYPDVRGSVYYTNGAIAHLWHGKSKNRLYESRKRILGKYNFDPDLDIKKDTNGCWAWNSNKPKLHRWAKRYFWLRNEQETLFRSSFMFFYNIKNWPLRRIAGKKIKQWINLLKVRI